MILDAIYLCVMQKRDVCQNENEKSFYNHILYYRNYLRQLETGNSMNLEDTIISNNLNEKEKSENNKKGKNNNNKKEKNKNNKQNIRDFGFTQIEQPKINIEQPKINQENNNNVHYTYDMDTCFEPAMTNLLLIKQYNDDNDIKQKRAKEKLFAKTITEIISKNNNNNNLKLSSINEKLKESKEKLNKKESKEKLKKSKEQSEKDEEEMIKQAEKKKKIRKIIAANSNFGNIGQLKTKIKKQKMQLFNKEVEIFKRNDVVYVRFKYKIDEVSTRDYEAPITNNTIGYIVGIIYQLSDYSQDKILNVKQLQGFLKNCFDDIEKDVAIKMLKKYSSISI